MDRDVPFDPVVDGEAVTAVRAATDDTVFSVVEYTTDDLHVAYVSEATRALYDDETDMYGHFDRIHSYVNLDIAEIALFTDDLFPFADDARFITTALDTGKMVRVYVSDKRGVFIGLEPAATVEPIVDALLNAVG
ncbi:hypothetical protein [Halosegnis sp.]|uniref:hypothetical protein n=1 Tax=Halosegnis sp. TaxID=2864959 RepID=UPI0035D4BCF9